MDGDDAVNDALERGLCEEHMRAVVATVAGGMAHHFNNLLSGVLGLVSLAPTLDPAAMGHLGERLKAQIDHASRLIRVVLTLTRRARDESGSGQCEAVNQVRDVVALAAVTAAANVTVEAELPDEEILVPISPVGVDRILLVLLIAAADRVAGEGAVRVALRPAAGACELLISATGDCSGAADLLVDGCVDRAALSRLTAARLIEAAGGQVEYGSDGAGLRWRVTLPVLHLA